MLLRDVLEGAPQQSCHALNDDPPVKAPEQKQGVPHPLPTKEKKATSTPSPVERSCQIPKKNLNPGKPIAKSKRAECNTSTRKGRNEQSKRPNPSYKFYLDLPWNRITPALARVLFIVYFQDHRIMLVFLSLVVDLASWGWNSGIPATPDWAQRIRLPPGVIPKLLLKLSNGPDEKPRYVDSSIPKPKASNPNPKPSLSTSVGPSTLDSDSKPECAKAFIQQAKNLGYGKVVDQLGALADQFVDRTWFDPVLRCTFFSILGEVDLSGTRVKKATSKEKECAGEEIPQLLDEIIRFKEVSLISVEKEKTTSCEKCHHIAERSSETFSVLKITLSCAAPELKKQLEQLVQFPELISRKCTAPQCCGCDSASVTTKVSSPPILIIHLDRYNANRIPDVDVSFDLSLELNQHIYSLSAVLAVIENTFVPCVNRDGIWYKSGPKGRGEERFDIAKAGKSCFLMFYTWKKSKEKFEKGEKEEG